MSILYDVAEIFNSIQGEGAHAGTAMIFVRFAGCNLSCPFCDTDHSVKMSLDKAGLIKAVAEHLPRKKQPAEPGPYWIQYPICFTGGEPTLQLDEDLLHLFLMEGYLLHLETNGIEVVPDPRLFRCITVSPKTIFTNWRPEKIYQKNTDLKIVYDTQNMKSTEELITCWGRLPFRNLFLQPCFQDGKANIEETLDYIQENPEWRLSLQLQRILKVK
jgi:organic radical activating enzyme